MRKTQMIDFDFLFREKSSWKKPERKKVGKKSKTG